MCNPGLILTLLLFGELATAGAASALWVSMIANANLFSTATTPGYLYGALAALAAAIGLVGAVISQLGNCTKGPCAGTASALHGLMIALSTFLTLLSGAISAIIWASAIPFATVTFIKVVLGIPLIAVGGLWLATIATFGAFAGCMGGISTVASTVQALFAAVAGLGLLGLTLALSLIHI